MEQTQNDWFKKIKGIFIEDSSPAATAPAQTGSLPNAAPMAAAVNYNATPADAGLIDDLVRRFQKLIEEKNQAGFDFFEYSTMVLGVSQSPSSDHFKIAFQGAKVMNAGVSKEQLLNSAAFYKQALETAYADTIKKGEEKRRAIEQQQVAQQQQLNQEIDGIARQIADFEKKIAELQASKATKAAQLDTLAGTFAPQITEVETKLNATALAKDQVMGRLAMIEAGIKQHV